MRVPAALLAIALLGSALGKTCAADASGVFVLEVPELGLRVNENSTATMPHQFVGRLQLRVLRSPQEISPGQVRVRVNGEAANIIMTTHSGDSGIVCDLDLYFRPGFLLHSGRNAIEASAESIYGRSYYASFLLDVRDQPASLREIQVQSYVTKPGEKPPVIQLLKPQGPVENLRQLSVQGYIEGGVEPVTLLVQGQPVHVATSVLPSGARGLQLELGAKSYSFDVPVKLASGQEKIEVTATDAHNNRMQLLIPVVQGTRAASGRYAVVIGVSRYRDSRIPGLRFADRDAETIRDFLLDPKGGGVPQANLRYLVNETATFANIRSALFDFLTKPGPEDLAIVYFAGHGTPDPKRPDNYYLVGYDAERDNIGGTAVPMWDLQAAFERTLHGKVVTLVDACHSAGIRETLPNLANQRWTKLGYGRQRAILTASDINELSKEGEKWGGGHGVFTYFVLKGLRGGADTNHDHQISVGELFDYVRRHVVEETGGQQTPTALAGSTRGLVLTQGVSRAAQASQRQPSSGGEAP